jgi:transposase, IS30 family
MPGNQLFTPEQIPCTKTLYNMLWANKLPLSLFEVPRALRHKRHRKWVRKNKRMKGRSIEERPAIVNDGTEIGHWEVDTVVGQRAGREAVVFTAVEKVTRNYIAIRIPGRTSAGVEAALAQLQELYGIERFSQIFKTMTADNGPEFETCRSSRAWHQDVLYASVQLVGTGSERTPQWLVEGFHPQGHVHGAIL